MKVTPTFALNMPLVSVELTLALEETLSRVLTDLGCRRPLIVASARFRRSDQGAAVARVVRPMANSWFDRVRQHPTMSLAVAGAEVANRARCDSIIAIGGGSAIDLAKGIALATRPGLLDNIIRQPRRGISEERMGSTPLPPLLAIPATLSGAEAIPRTGLIDADGHKRILRHPQISCRAIILDPAGNLAVPAEVMVPSGMNALAHCFEALYSKANDPISSALSICALPRLFQGLQKIMGKDGPGARALALTGAFMAGRAIVNARTGLHHAVCHVLGARGIPHGLANTTLLPHALRFNAMASGNLLDDAATALGLDTKEPAATLANAVDALREMGGLPRRLRDIGIMRDQFGEIARQVIEEPGMAYNPGPELSYEDIVAFLNQSY